MVMPVDLFSDHANSVISDPNNYHDYVLELKRKLDHEIAREEIKKISQIQKKNYDQNVRKIKYCVDDKVYCFQSQQILGTKLQLARNWSD